MVLQGLLALGKWIGAGAIPPFGHKAKALAPVLVHGPRERRRPPRRAWWAAWLVLLATCGLLGLRPGSRHTPCAVRPADGQARAGNADDSGLGDFRRADGTRRVPATRADGTRSVAAARADGTRRVPATSCEDHDSSIRLCQALGPAAPCAIPAVDGSHCDCSRWGGWEKARIIAWQCYAQGEYVGHARTAHVPEYRLRVDDQLDLIYRLTREETSKPYRLNVGDEIRVESFTDPDLNRDLILQPDGTITLRLLGQVRATGLTVPQLREELDRQYAKYYKVPAITVTPLRVNTKLDDLLDTVDRRYGVGGQSQFVRVTPEGTIALPMLGSVPAQGLTLPELQQELNERYRQDIEGIEVIPVLAQRAPRFVYVLGEVARPGPLRAERADHRDAGDQHGRQLERGGQPAPDRGLPPRRRLAPDGHDARTWRPP